MKHFKLMLVLVVALAVTVGAQSNMPNVEANTDKPITTAWWHDISIKLISNDMYDYLGWDCVYDILYGLSNMGLLGAQAKSDINYFLGKFQPGAEVYSMALNQGDTAYVTEFGEIYDPEAQNYYSTDFNVTQSTNYTYYAGRNTSLGNYSNSAQIQLTTHGRQYNISMYANTTPLVLDLDGNNKLDIAGGSWLPDGVAKDSKMVPFDINGDGFEDLVEWIGPNDGLLLVYKGSANVSGLDLFGSAGGFAHGYEKLSLLDVNQDGVLTENELSTLSVWQDKNGNAMAESDEVKSVKALGITSISVKHHHLVSSFVQNGKTVKMWDWNPTMVLVKKSK